MIRLIHRLVTFLRGSHRPVAYEILRYEVLHKNELLVLKVMRGAAGENQARLTGILTAPYRAHLFEVRFYSPPWKSIHCMSLAGCKESPRSVRSALNCIIQQAHERGKVHLGADLPQFTEVTR